MPQLVTTTLRETCSQRTCHHLGSNPRHLMWSASVQPLNYCMVLYATHDHLSAQTVAYSRWLDNVHECNPGNTMQKNPHYDKWHTSRGLSTQQVLAQLWFITGQDQMAYVLRQFIKILHDRVHEAPPSRLVMHDRSMDPLHLPRSPHVQQTSRVGTPWTARQLSSVQLKSPWT